ncbi:MAG TPA: hypothetical protein VJ550_13135 [Geomonas sp.]|nr:hypothetical protein [Geomonas sp.]
MKETDHRAAIAADEKKGSLALVPLVGVYLFCLLITFSHLGEPFPFMGELYPGESSEKFAFLDCILILYLMVGILKRQTLTLWLLIGYNVVKSFSEIANLLLLPVQQTVTAAGTLVPDYHYRLNAFCMAVVFLLLNVFLYINRRHFDNKSVYLW